MNTCKEEEKVYLEMVKLIQIFLEKNKGIRPDSLERLWDVHAEIVEKHEEAKNSKPLIYLN